MLQYIYICENILFNIIFINIIVFMLISSNIHKYLLFFVFNLYSLCSYIPIYIHIYQYLYILQLKIYTKFEPVMGILESCENPGIAQSRLSFAMDSKFFGSSDYRGSYNSTDFYFQQSKIQLFGDIFYKKNGEKTQFVLQTHMTNRATQVMNHSLKIYPDSASFMHEKGSKIKIITPIDDPNYIGKQLFLIKIQGKPKQIAVKLVPFNRYQDVKFKKGLYEVAMLHANLRQQNNRFGFVYQDAFVIQSGIDKDCNDKCLVIIGDTSNATLDQMINYRKMSQITWKQKQFQALAYQLLRGVQQMHKSKLYHRDIRPHNIFYSPQKKGYILGGFSNALNLNGVNQNIGLNLAAVPYYLPPYLLEVGKKQDYSEYYNYDPEQLDIYSLGVTLLNTLFLDQFMPADALKRSASKYQQKYRLLSTITQMLDQNPPSLTKILTNFGQDMNSRVIDQRNQIQAYRFRTKPQDQQFVSRKKIIASGYYQMFMYDDWVQQINQVVNYYELNHDSLQLADIYKQIAEIYSQHHQQQLTIEYYCRASSIFLQISNQCLLQNKNQQAIKYLEKGIDCNRKGYKCQPNTDLAYLLNKLAMTNHINQEYQIARAFQQEALEIVGKVNGDNSSQYAEMLIDAAKIEMQFKQFKQSENMLKAGLKIIDKKQLTKQNQSIKSRLLQSLGNNFRFKAMVRMDKCEVYRKKSEQCLLDSLEITERVEGSIHPHVGSVLMNLGSLYFDRKQFDKSKRSYQKSLIVKQHSNKGKETIQIGQCLTYLANSQKYLKQYDKAIKHYDQSIEVFRRTYGNDHNHNTAIAIGNLGLLYKQMGRRKQQKQYLNLAKGILKDLFGQSCPDYQYFDRQLTI